MGRGYAAAKARRQAAGAVASGQGAVAEPVVAAQPAPAPEGESLFGREALETARGIDKSLREANKDIRSVKAGERPYETQADTIFFQSGRDAADEYRTVSGAAIAARFAAEDLYKTIRRGPGTDAAKALAATRLAEGMKLLRRAQERLSDASLSRSRTTAAIQDGRPDVRNAIRLFESSANALRFYSAAVLNARNRRI